MHIYIYTYIYIYTHTHTHTHTHIHTHTHTHTNMYISFLFTRSPGNIRNHIFPDECAHFYCENRFIPDITHCFHEDCRTAVSLYVVLFYFLHIYILFIAEICSNKL